MKIIYGSWNIMYDRQNFRHFGPFFALSAPWQPGKSKFLALKNTPGDIIILHICTINDNYMMYGSWDMGHNGQNVLSFWTFLFALLPPINNKHMMYASWYQAQRTEFFVILEHFFFPLTAKNQNLKNWKEYLEILSFYTCVP